MTSILLRIDLTVKYNGDSATEHMQKGPFLTLVIGLGECKKECMC